MLLMPLLINSMCPSLLNQKYYKKTRYYCRYIKLISLIKTTDAVIAISILFTYEIVIGQS